MQRARRPPAFHRDVSGLVPLAEAMVRAARKSGMTHIPPALAARQRGRPDAYPEEGGGFVRRDYELAFILNPEVSEEETRSILERLDQIVATYGGQTVKVNQWGRRRLAYPIERHRDGFYVFIDLILTPETVAELERTLKVSEVVLRYMTKQRDAKVVQKEREEREARAAAAAAAATAAAAPAATPTAPEGEASTVGSEEHTEGAVGQTPEGHPILADEELEDVPPAIEDPEIIEA